MRLNRLSILTFSGLAVIQHTTARFPKQYVNDCNQNCLDKFFEKVCPLSNVPEYLTTCLCKEENAQQLRKEVLQCVRALQCSQHDIEQTKIGFSKACIKRHHSASVSTTTKTKTAPAPTGTPSSPGSSNTGNTPATPAKGSGSSAQESNTSSGLSSGAQAGIGVAVAIVILAIFGVIGYFIFKQRRQRQQRQKDEAAKHMSQGSTAEAGQIRAELSGRDARHEMEDGKMFQELPPSYFTHEKDGTPTTEKDINKEVYEMPTSPDRPSILEQDNELERRLGQQRNDDDDDDDDENTLG